MQIQEPESDINSKPFLFLVTSSRDCADGPPGCVRGPCVSAASCHVFVCRWWTDSPAALPDILPRPPSFPQHADTAPAGSWLFPSRGRSAHLAESKELSTPAGTLWRTCRHLGILVPLPVCQQQLATCDFLQIGGVGLEVDSLHLHRPALLLMGEPVELLTPGAAVDDLKAEQSSQVCSRRTRWLQGPEICLRAEVEARRTLTDRQREHFLSAPLSPQVTQ